MEPCVNCGTTEETTSVCTCDCQCLETARRSGCREIKLIAPTRDTATAWAENDPILPEGVLALVKDRLFEGSVEYIIGDGESKYSELIEAHSIYAGAPLSRTGAENHSPLAASGKSTLDPSWLPAATSSALGAVMTSTTGAEGKVPIAGSNGALDPSWLPAATSTTLGGVKASTTTAANCVVQADGNGSLAGWSGALASALANENGGLVVDENTGDLMVDFSQMPTDKFEALLKGLKMLVPLSAPLDLYVDKNSTAAADTIVDGRGTLALPFKTIQAAINYVTSTYALGPYSVNIYIAQATYNENVNCPEYSRSTGSITLRAYEDSNPPTIKNVGDVGDTIAVVGGVWYLRRLNIENTARDPGNGLTNISCGLSVSNSRTEVGIQGCSLSIEYEGSAPATGSCQLRLISIQSNAVAHIYALAGYQTSLVCDKGNASLAHMLRVERYGQFHISGGNATEEGNMYKVACSGVVDVFASVALNASIITFGGLLYNQTFVGTVTGKKYDITKGGTVSGPYGGFPGDVNGTVESATYCWYV